MTTHPEPETYLETPDIETFQKLTDTGKFRAVTAWQQRADAAEAKLEQITRNVFGIIRVLMTPDEAVVRFMKMVEKDKQKQSSVIK